jgi:hypothetical protein
MDTNAKYGFKLMKMHHHAGHHRKRVAMETDVVITIEGYFMPELLICALQLCRWWRLRLRRSNSLLRLSTNVADRDMKFTSQHISLHFVWK